MKGSRFTQHVLPVILALAPFCLSAEGNHNPTHVSIIPLMEWQKQQAVRQEIPLNEKIQQRIMELRKMRYVYIDPPTKELLLKQPELSRTLILESFETLKTTQPLTACGLLRTGIQHLSMEEEEPRLWAEIQQADANRVLAAVEAIRSLYGSVDGIPQEMPPELQRRYYPLLQHEDPKIVDKAMWGCLFMELDEARPYLVKLTDSDIHRKRAFYVLSSMGMDPDLQEHLFAYEWPDLSLDVYSSMLMSEDPVVAKRARESFAHYISKVPERKRFSYWLHNALARLKHPEFLPYVRSALQQENVHHKKELLEALGASEIPEDLELLFQSLEDPSLRRGALLGLVEKMPLEKTSEYWLRISKAYQEQSKRSKISYQELNVFLTHFRGKSTELIEELFPSLHWSTQMLLLWHLKGIDAEKALTQFETAGLLDMSKTEEEERIIRYRAEESLQDPHKYPTLYQNRIFWSTLEVKGVLDSFDAESDQYPSPHDELLQSLSTHFPEGFRPTEPEQQLTKEPSKTNSPPFIVSFSLGKNRYVFKAENYGDWYDVKSVFTALNFAMRNEGRSEQIIQIYTGGQFVEYVVADQDTFKKLARDLHISIEPNTNLAREQGQEYERKVIELLNRKATSSPSSD